MTLPSAFAHLLDGAASPAGAAHGEPNAASRGGGDEALLWRALDNAARGVGRTAPNPPVGAVVVKDGFVLGDGHHARAGDRHAEVVALDAVLAAHGAGAARGSTMFVTLEPCVHHGRTPPCSERVIAEGVARVVVGALDPNPAVHGKGVARLRQAGVAVAVAAGAVADRCAALIAPFSRALVDGRVYVVLKIAASLDGRVATANGASRWITGAPARALVHRLRDACDAVVVGAGTVLADDPALTVRDVPGRDPLRVILDGRGRVPASARALAGAVHVRAEPGRDHVDLRAALADLARGRGLAAALVEAGPGLATALLEQDLVDELWWMTAPVVLGGDALPAVGALGLAAPADGPRFSVLHRAALGDDAVAVLRRIGS